MIQADETDYRRVIRRPGLGLGERVTPPEPPERPVDTRHDRVGVPAGNLADHQDDREEPFGRRSANATTRRRR